MVADVAGLVLATPPELEPISLAEAKAHLRVDIDAEDTLISSIIVAARQAAEAEMGKQLITASYELNLDRFPCSRVIELPRPPLQSVESITYYDADGDSTVLSAATYYHVDTARKPGRIVLRDGQTWPTTETGRPGAVVIAYTAGMGDDSDAVDELIRMGILMLITHLFENRAAVSDGAKVEVPMGAKYCFGAGGGYVKV